MIQVPHKTKIAFDALLVKKAIPERFHSYYRRWLRYYLDFCQKYHFDSLNNNSLPSFINKLKGKKQSEQQQKQGSHAVSIYYEVELSDSKNEIAIARSLGVRPSFLTRNFKCQE